MHLHRTIPSCKQCVKVITFFCLTYIVYTQLGTLGLVFGSVTHMVSKFEQKKTCVSICAYKVT